MKTEPEDGLSRPPIMLNKVVFPDPDGPMMEIYSPVFISRSIPLSTCTTVLPRLKSFVTLETRTILFKFSIFNSFTDNSDF